MVDSLRFPNKTDRFRPVSMAMAVVSLVFLIEIPASSKIYQYTDSQGVLHLTNVPGKSPTRSKTRRNTPRPTVKVPEGAMYECTPQEVIKLIDILSLSEGIDPILVKAVARAESGFNPKAVSPKGAIGVMQLMPETAARFDVNDIFHPEQNIRGGIRYLKYLTGLFPDDVKLAVAAYNAGEGRIINSRSIPPIEETVNYVDRVLQYYNRYKYNTVTRPIKRLIDSSGHIHLTNM